MIPQGYVNQLEKAQKQMAMAERNLRTVWSFGTRYDEHVMIGTYNLIEPLEKLRRELLSLISVLKAQRNAEEK
jgi:hypothetical protein